MRLWNLKQVGSQLKKSDCHHLSLTNTGIEDHYEFWLTQVAEVPLGDVVILGAAEYSIAFESVERNKIITPDGMKTKCIIPSDVCVGSRTVITNLFGEAWHVSSNVPLLFE